MSISIFAMAEGSDRTDFDLLECNDVMGTRRRKQRKTYSHRSFLRFLTSILFLLAFYFYFVSTLTKDGTIVLQPIFSSSTRDFSFQRFYAKDTRVSDWDNDRLTKESLPKKLEFPENNSGSGIAQSSQESKQRTVPGIQSPPGTGAHSSRGEGQKRKKWLTAAELPECPWNRDEARQRFPRDNTSSTALVYESQAAALERLMSATDHSYIFVYGTAIGIYRHGGVIPWDLDMDVLVLPEEDGSTTEEELSAKVFDDFQSWLSLPAAQGGGASICRAVTKQGRGYQNLTEREVFWHDPYYENPMKLRQMLADHIPFIRLHLYDATRRLLTFRNQLDLFVDHSYAKKAIDFANPNANLCRCYFNGVAGRCSRNTLDMLIEQYGEKVATEPLVDVDATYKDDEGPRLIDRDIDGWYQAQILHGNGKCQDAAQEGETWRRMKSGDVIMGGEPIIPLWEEFTPYYTEPEDEEEEATEGEEQEQEEEEEVAAAEVDPIAGAESTGEVINNDAISGGTQAKESGDSSESGSSSSETPNDQSKDARTTEE